MTRTARAALITFVVLLGVYSFTLAPDVTPWDAGEFLAAIRTLGIPHPPGTPLYVLIARCWSFLFAPVLGFARAINLFSAACTAAALALVASMFTRWTHDTMSGVCAALVAGGMTTVWLSATETEVYAPALLVGCILLWSADRAGLRADRRWALLAAYLAGLGLALHLSALLVVPSAALLTFSGKDGYLGVPRAPRRSDGRRPRQSGAALAWSVVAMVVLGASCILFLLVRARHDPAINQGDPSALGSLWRVITRAQYGPRSLWPRQAPLYLQIANVFEYADWQVARGLGNGAAPSLWRTSITLVFAALGVYGSYWHFRLDRRSWRAWLLLLLVGSFGVVVYLNMKLGPSFGGNFVPADAAHEARERDYFFFFAFAAWGAWSGLGLARLSKIFPAALQGIPLALVIVPFALNWPVANRSNRAEDAGARSAALGILAPLPAGAVLLSIGDNDTYPLWYLQQVEHVRRDVTVVTIPLLSAEWYRAELLRRSRLVDSATVRTWLGTAGTLATIQRRAAAEGRPVIDSPYREGRD